MAIRGKVKDIKIGPMGKATGTVTDTASRINYPFVQPFGEQLGLQENSIVQFETVQSSGTTYGVSLDPVERGTIQSINYELETGVLTDRFNNPIDFEQNYGKEMGLVQGSEVRYVIVTVDGKQKATALKLAGNQ
jgi:hypothetical protein